MNSLETSLNKIEMKNEQPKDVNIKSNETAIEGAEKPEMAIVEGLVFNNISIWGKKLLERKSEYFDDAEKTKWKNNIPNDTIKRKVLKTADNKYQLSFGYLLKDKNEKAIIDKKQVITIDFTIKEGTDYKKVILTPSKEQKETIITDTNGNERFFNIASALQTDGADIQIEENEEKTLKAMYEKINKYELSEDKDLDTLLDKTEMSDLKFLKDIKLSKEINKQDPSDITKGFVKKIFIDQKEKYYPLGEMKFDKMTEAYAEWIPTIKFKFLYEDISIPVTIDTKWKKLTMTKDNELENKLNILAEKIMKQKDQIVEYMNNTTVASEDTFPILFKKTVSYKTELNAPDVYKWLNIEGTYSYDVGNTNVLNFTFTQTGEIQLQNNLWKSADTIYYHTKNNEYYEIKINKELKRLDFKQIDVKNFPYMEARPQLDHEPSSLTNALFYYNDTDEKNDNGDLIKIEKSSYFDKKWNFLTKLPVTKDINKNLRKLETNTIIVNPQELLNDTSFDFETILSTQGIFKSEIKDIFEVQFIEAYKSIVLKNSVKVKKDTGWYEYYALEQDSDGKITFTKDKELEIKAKKIIDKIKNDIKTLDKLDKIQLRDTEKNAEIKLTWGMRIFPLDKTYRLSFLNSNTEKDRQLLKSFVYNKTTNEKENAGVETIGLNLVVDKNNEISMKPIKGSFILGKKGPNIASQTYKKIYFEDGTLPKLNLDIKLEKVNFK